MDSSRISFGEAIAALSGLLLFVFMLFPWYRTSATIGSFTASRNVTAWVAFSVIDILLLIVVLVAVGTVVAGAAGVLPAGLRAVAAAVVTAAGGVAVLLILYRLVSLPGLGVSDALDSISVGRGLGPFLGLLAAGGVAFGGFTAVKERAPGSAPPTV